MKTDADRLASGQRVPGSRRGFSLVELLIAIGIIALLATITTVVARNVVAGMKERNTKGTIGLLVAALQVYKDHKDSHSGFVFPPDPFLFADPVVGGPLDSVTGLPNGAGGSGDPSDLVYFYNSFYYRWNSVTAADFTLSGHLTSIPQEWDHWDDLSNSEQSVILGARASIEVLYTYLDDIPDCRELLNRIPEDAKGNEDLDSVNFGAGRKNLVEIVDGWKIPLRYQNRGIGNFPLITSAGADGLFDTDDDILSDQL